ncbi:MAG: hypothetical protein AB8F78_10870 [Saprospiraceae bacterium]
MQEAAVLNVTSAMKYLLIGLSLLFVLLTSCSKNEQVEKRNEDGIVTERYSRSKQDSLMNGAYEAFDDKGNLLERAFYSQGRLNGDRMLYYPNGGLQYKESHLDGEFIGPYQAYYPEGQLELEGEYIDNKMSGIWTAYYPSGTVKETVTFVDNDENGPFKEWYSNGVVKAEGEYANGDKEEGELILYDLEGNVNKRMYCEAGICKTVWSAEKAVSNEG